jgi:hypothetical protein
MVVAPEFALMTLHALLQRLEPSGLSGFLDTFASLLLGKTVENHA